MTRETDAYMGDYMLKEMTGEEFCTYFPNLSKKLVKLTNEEENHNWFQFKTGLNVDSIPFNPIPGCQPGGIYFTDIDNIARWLDYGKGKMKYCREVTLPSDSRVYIEENKYKADKMILGERVEIKDLPYWSDNDYCMSAVRQDVKSLKYIRDINNDIQLEILKRDRHMIYYLLDEKKKNKIEISKEVQMEAIKGSGPFIIKHLLDNEVDMPKEVQLEAVKQNWRVINYLFDKKVDMPKEVQLEAIKQDWHAITSVLGGILDKKIDVPIVGGHVSVFTVAACSLSYICIRSLM